MQLLPLHLDQSPFLVIRKVTESKKTNLHTHTHTHTHTTKYTLFITNFFKNCTVYRLHSRIYTFTFSKSCFFLETLLKSISKKCAKIKWKISIYVRNPFIFHFLPFYFSIPYTIMMILKCGSKLSLQTNRTNDYSGG